MLFLYPVYNPGAMYIGPYDQIDIILLFVGQEQCKQAIDLPNPLDYGGTCPGSHDLFVQG